MGPHQRRGGWRKDQGRVGAAQRRRGCCGMSRWGLPFFGSKARGEAAQGEGGAADAGAAGGGGAAGGATEWQAAEGRYCLAEARTGGAYRHAAGAKDFLVAVQSREEGLNMLKQDPGKWAGVWGRAQAGFVPMWTLVRRGSSFAPEPGTDFEWVQATYTGIGPASFTDDFCGGILRRYGQHDISEHYKRIGRGEGLCDEPGLKLFGDIDPCDVQQRGIGDCWLMCSISACAEFDGLISSLFSPQRLSQEGKYTVSLFDLPSQTWKKYTIDDRLQSCPQDGSRLRFADLSPEKEVLAAKFTGSLCLLRASISGEF